MSSEQTQEYDDALVEVRVNVLSGRVEESQADVAHRADGSQLFLLFRGDRVSALPQ